MQPPQKQIQKKESDIIIKGEWEDEIYRVREFIQELKKVEDIYYDKLYSKLKEEGFDERLESWLWDFIFNDDFGKVEFKEHLANHNVTNEALVKSQKIKDKLEI